MSAGFDLVESPAILARTPIVLDAMLREMPAPLLCANEGPDTWSPFDVVGHLAHGERTDWMPRAEHLLEHGESVPFPVFDRFAQFELSRGKSIGQLLDEFRSARNTSLARLATLQLRASDLARSGTHPEFGRVTLGEHLATWVAHDFDHLLQISRVVGRQYHDAVGPWRKYLRVVTGPGTPER